MFPPKNNRNNDFAQSNEFNRRAQPNSYFHAPQVVNSHSCSTDESSHLLNSNFQDLSYYFEEVAETPGECFSHRSKMILEPDLPINNPFPLTTTRDLIRNMSMDSPLVESEDKDRLCKVPRDSQDSFKIMLPGMMNRDRFGSPKIDFLRKHFIDEEDCHSQYETMENGKFLSKPEELEEQLFTGKKSPDEKVIVISDAPSSQEITSISRRKKNKESTAKPSSRKTRNLNPEDFAIREERRMKQDSKNVVKNYGKAMSGFALTDLARPYREELLASHHISFDNFKKFVINYKERIDSIGSFREMILPSAEDTDEVGKIKIVLRSLCEIFVRDFALNWIFSSKSNQRAILLKYRFKILRRVQNPSKFTYLKNMQ